MAFEPSQVRTQQGVLRGQIEEGLHVFRGVPFAEPPIGVLRWRDPQPLRPWTGVRDALAFGPTSIQTWVPGMTELGAIPEPVSEDCLYLNVWTPGIDDVARPVMFWIHGGGLTLGSGSTPAYWGDRLAARGDVVVVTINYRLGALGFLADPVLSDGGDSPGNYGFKDQVTALEWVRDNIASFGGDPGNVTIFGESAGGVSVATMLGTPKATGLFHHAIQQSGAADHALPLAVEAAARPLFYETIGIEGQPSAGALRSIPAQQLLEGQAGMRLNPELLDRLDGHMNLFNAVIDGDFLDASPIDAVRQGRALEVDLMAGTIRDEWTLLSWVAGIDDMNEEAAIGALAPLCGGITRTSDLYTGYRELRLARGERANPLDVYNAIMTDRVFRLSLREVLDAHGEGHAGTYAYLFDQESPMLDGALGAPHALDLPFVFGTSDRTPALTGEGAQIDQLTERVMDAWIAFARTGNPGTSGLPEWPQYRADLPSTMALGPELRIVTEDREEELALWRT